MNVSGEKRPKRRAGCLCYVWWSESGREEGYSKAGERLSQVLGMTGRKSDKELYATKSTFGAMDRRSQEQ